MNDGRRLGRQDRQAVVDGSGERAVNRDGETRDFAKRKKVRHIPVILRSLPLKLARVR